MFFSCSSAGTALRYTDKDANNRYLGPGGQVDALVFNPGNQTWTQTQNDWFQTIYDSTGKAVEFTDNNNNVWTLGYDTSNRLVSIVGPFSRMTALTYVCRTKLWSHLFPN
jgi:YD repeat-containing protein